MDRIHQYLKICQVRPDYYNIPIPYQAITKKRLTFTLEETNLQFDKERGMYVAEPSKKDDQKQGDQKQGDQKQGGHEKNQISVMKLDISSICGGYDDLENISPELSDTLYEVVH